MRLVHYGSLRHLPWLLLFAVAGCTQNTSDPRLNELETRLEGLSSRVEALEIAQNQAINAPVAAPPMEYALTGRGALSAAGTRYPSLKRCEAAKQVLVNDSGRRAQQMAEKGLTVIGEPEISCVPL